MEIVNPGKFPPQLNAESIKQPHESYPYNKSIAQVLYLTTYLEKWGFGAKRMMEHCREHNVPEPEWIVENGTVKIVFKRPSILIDDSQSGNQNVSQSVSQSDGLNDRQRRIKIMIHDNDRISVSVISKALEVTPRTIYRDLKIIGFRWEGSPKTGHWTFD